MMLADAWLCLLSLWMHPMKQERPIDVKNLTISGSQTFLRSDGRAALLLMTKEIGAIALELNQQSIDIFRKHLINRGNTFAPVDRKCMKAMRQREPDLGGRD